MTGFFLDYIYINYYESNFTQSIHFLVHIFLKGLYRHNHQGMESEC